MGEVNHPDDPVNHRVANRDQAVDHAQRDAVDELLQCVGQSRSNSVAERNATMQCGYGARGERHWLSTRNRLSPYYLIQGGISALVKI